MTEPIPINPGAVPVRNKRGPKRIALPGQKPVRRPSVASKRRKAAEEALRDRTAQGLAIVAQLQLMNGGRPVLDSVSLVAGGPAAPPVQPPTEGAKPGESLIPGTPEASGAFLDDARNLAVRHSTEAVQTIIDLMRSETAPPIVRWRCSAELLKIAEGGKGTKQVGMMTVPELRALAEQLRGQERTIDGEATVLPDANPLAGDARQLDQASGGLPLASRASSAPDDVTPAPGPTRARRSID